VRTFERSASAIWPVFDRADLGSDEAEGPSPEPDLPLRLTGLAMGRRT
jgi:hypothetical protein